MLLVVGGVGALQTCRFVASATGSDGTVTRLNAGGSHPQITFGTPAGDIVSYPQGGMVAGFRVGQSVRVLYDPKSPRGTARVQTFGSLWGGSLAAGLGGAALLALALASFIFPIGFYLRG